MSVQQPNSFRTGPDERGHFGIYGGRFVAETLMPMILELEEACAEPRAGMHGVATATLCSKSGLQCIVYMGAVDVERQQPNVLRMKALGAQVRPVESGSTHLKEAINEALRDWGP